MLKKIVFEMRGSVAESPAALTAYKLECLALGEAVHMYNNKELILSQHMLKNLKLSGCSWNLVKFCWLFILWKEITMDTTFYVIDNFKSNISETHITATLEVEVAPQSEDAAAGYLIIYMKRGLIEAIFVMNMCTATLIATKIIFLEIGLTQDSW
ncbi:hypothetical protein ACJX0J_034567, partial [Zea mays]